LAISQKLDYPIKRVYLLLIKGVVYIKIIRSVWKFKIFRRHIFVEDFMNKMTNKRLWLGMLVMVLAFGMTVIGCDDGSTDDNGGGGTDAALNGTWYSTTPGYDFYFKLNNGHGESFINGNPHQKWTYTTSSGKMTENITQQYNVSESKWETYNYSKTSDYSISGNTLTITATHGSVTYIRK
jgi:hypothetical protein